MTKFHIFISWSGKESREIAERLKDFLRAIFPTLNVFLSTEDIGSGERWLSVVSSALDESVFGIAVLTPQNVVKPWIHFEAGAISKSVQNSRLVPLLCGLSSGALRDTPLSGFQAEPLEEAGILSLLRAIRAATDYPIEDARLMESFEVWWQSKGANLVDISHIGSERVEEPSPLTLDDIYLQLSDLEGYIRDLDRSVRKRMPINALTAELEPRRGIFGGGQPRTIAAATRLIDLLGLEDGPLFNQALQNSMEASAPSETLGSNRPPDEDLDEG